MGVILQIPALRRRVFSWLEMLADWHERGTESPNTAVSHSQADPFMLARAGEKLLREQRNE